MVTLRPVTPADADDLRAIRATAEVVAWWGEPEPGDPLVDEPGTVKLSILSGDAVVGLIQYSEESEPAFRHAGIDLFVAPHAHSRGIGTDAVKTLARHLIEDRGHHRLTIDPALENAAAVRCYEKAGFRRVGTMRAYWRDGSGRWRDGLLMELVVSGRR